MKTLNFIFNQLSLVVVIAAIFIIHFRFYEFDYRFILILVVSLALIKIMSEFINKKAYGRNKSA